MPDATPHPNGDAATTTLADELMASAAEFSGMLRVKPLARTPYARGLHLVACIEELLPRLERAAAALASRSSAAAVPPNEDDAWFSVDALRRLASELTGVDWPGGANGQQTIEDAADRIEELQREVERLQLPCCECEPPEGAGSGDFATTQGYGGYVCPEHRELADLRARLAAAVPVPGDGGLREAVEKLPGVIQHPNFVRRDDVLALLAARLSSVGASADTERREEWVVQLRWTEAGWDDIASADRIEVLMRYDWWASQHGAEFVRLRHRIITERTVEPSAALSQEARP